MLLLKLNNKLQKTMLMAVVALSLHACGGSSSEEEEPEQQKIGGTVINLNSDLLLVLKKDGADWESLTVTGSGGNVSFSFIQAQNEGINFAIVIRTNSTETSQDCAITTGGSGVLSAANANTTVITCTNTSPSVGVFLDSAVGNISYSTATQSGNTNDDGEFFYFPGESVTFSLGAADLPTVEAEALMTPLTLAQTDNIDHSTVINIARLLISLDVDSDPDNGLMLDDAVQANVSMLNFALSVEEFANQAEVETLLANAGLQQPRTTLVSVETAKNHLQQTLIDNDLLPPPVTSCDESLIFQLEGKDIISQSNGELQQTTLSGTLTITPSKQCTLEVNEGYSGACTVSGTTLSAFDGQMTGTIGNKEATLIVKDHTSDGEHVAAFLSGAAENSCAEQAVPDGQYILDGREAVVSGNTYEGYGVTGTLTISNGSCSVQSTEGDFSCLVEGNSFSGVGEANALRGTITEDSASYYMPVVTSDNETFYGQYSATRN
jgi:hypothetical protein